MAPILDFGRSSLMASLSTNLFTSIEVATVKGAVVFLGVFIGILPLRLITISKI
jgi:hypothetical protein